MKKNVIVRVAAIVVMCALVTACFASSTFAKYTSTASSTSTSAVVAKWDLSYGDNKFTTESPTVTFDVFETVNGHNAGDQNTTKLAPGTNGSFTIAAIENDSDVVANVAVKVTDITADDTLKGKIKFYSDSAMTKPIVVAKDYVFVSDSALAPTESTTATTIYWQWVYDTMDATEDTSDTTLGITGTATYAITIELSATQVD